jgi:hypothetical protein
MNEKHSSTRTLIQRRSAESYLFLMLISFAGSVTVTRLFLQMTGYPKIGNGELHIAHVLWGGLLLFIASLMPLIFANRWMLSLSAALSGIGVGLFIDEVGKFITQTNDYFYPSAAPIIYSFFLLTVLLYIIIRRRQKESVRSDLYFVLEDLEEVLDNDLSARELERMKSRLQHVSNRTKDENIILLAGDILNFVENKELEIVPEFPTRYQRFGQWLNNIEAKVVTHMRFRAILSGALIALSMWALTFPLTIISRINSPRDLEVILNGLFQNRLVRSPTGLTFFGTRIGLEGSVGLILFIAGIMLAFGKERRAILTAYVGLLISLTIVNILVFYFDQFTTIINAIIQFALLLGVARYRKRFLKI